MKRATEIKTATNVSGRKETEEKKRDRRSWTDKEKEESLDYLLNTIQSGHVIEKPNAYAYYETAAKKLDFIDCSGKQLRNTIYNMKRKYTQAKDWRSKTGEGILIEEGEESVAAKLRKMCPFFDKLDEVFGSRSSISPPVVHDSAGPRSHVCNPQDEPNSQFESTEEEPPSTIPTPNTPLPPSTIPKIDTTTKKRKNSESGMEALASTAKLKFEFQKEELLLKKDKWVQEKESKESEIQLLRDKFEFEKVVAERKLALEERRIQNEFELEKYRVDQNLKLQVELAKMKNNER
ncbi:unnamed protein product [Orchesella dallaii]|uniref:Uncharacterized protein n=1 Tax=Orchesella dallaii TaxID=48710 RepID=A0ABP1QNJ8_9HEXA